VRIDTGTAPLVRTYKHIVMSLRVPALVISLSVASKKQPERATVQDPEPIKRGSFFNISCSPRQGQGWLVVVRASKCFEQSGAQWPSQTCISSDIGIAIIYALL
jgi:hypothetical protein